MEKLGHREAESPKSENPTIPRIWTEMSYFETRAIFSSATQYCLLKLEIPLKNIFKT